MERPARATPTSSSPTSGSPRSSGSGSIHRRCARGIPRLIYGIITGYGLEGPDAHRPGYDVGAFWARSTLASSVVPRGRAAAADPRRVRRPCDRDDARRRHLRRPVRPRAHRAWAPRVDEPVADRAVLRRRGTSGCCCASASWRAPAPATSRGRRSSTATPPPTARRSGCSAWRSDRHWPALVAALDRPDLAADERFATAPARARALRRPGRRARRRLRRTADGGVGRRASTPTTCGGRRSTTRAPSSTTRRSKRPARSSRCPATTARPAGRSPAPSTSTTSSSTPARSRAGRAQRRGPGPSEYVRRSF